MNSDFFKAKINNIISGTATCGLSIFVRVKKEDGATAIKKFLVTDELRDAITRIIVTCISDKYIDHEIDSADNVADDKKILYEVVQTETYAPFSFLDECTADREQYDVTSNDTLSGFIFRVNLNDDVFWVYQHVYPMHLVKKSKLHAVLAHDNTYKPLDRDLIGIESRIDCIILENSIITNNINLLQNTFGFDKYIRAEARKTLVLIQSLGVVDELDKFVQLAEKDKLTFSKKLMKAKTSPVLLIDPDELIKRIQVHPRYKDQIKIEHNKICVRSQKDATAFVKMLNDDIVRSELTHREYDSSSKQILAPLN